MSSPADPASPRAVVAVVSAADGSALAAAGRLLDAFNREYDDPTPGQEILAARLGELIDGGDTDVLLIAAALSPAAASAAVSPAAASAAEPVETTDWVGVAVLRHRRSLWTPAVESTLAELYVSPTDRGRGLGRQLVDAAFAHAGDRGADYIEVVTSDDDVAAWHLYESVGFRRTEGTDGPMARFYERDL